jgi:hypothetical protein
MASPEMAAKNEDIVSAVIYVRPKTWARLNARKQQGITFDDVITELLDDADETLAEDTR